MRNLDEVFDIYQSFLDLVIRDFGYFETAKANGANPYYYLKYLLEEMPKHMEEEGRSFLEDMVPWCDRYRKYEEAQIRLIAASPVGEDQEKPLTPKRRKRRAS